MNVLQIGKFNESFSGGMETAIHSLSDGLKKINIQSDIFCFGDTNAPQLHFLGQPLSLNWYSQLQKIIGNYNLIHLHIPNLQAELSLPFLKYNQRIIVTYHSQATNFPIIKKPYQFILNKTLSRAEKIIISAPKNQRFDLLNKYESKVKIIPFGVSIPSINLLNIQEQEKNQILYLGRLVPFKGIDYLIKCLPELNTQLIIAGSGPEEKRLKALVKKLNLDKKVLFYGNVQGNKKAMLLQESKLLVLPSINDAESFGICLIEAMAYGKPIITTNLNSGVNNVNEHLITGLSVEAKSVEKLKQAIRTLLDNTRLRHLMGLNAFEKAKKSFPLNLYIKEHANLYAEVLGLKTLKKTNVSYNQDSQLENF